MKLFRSPALRRLVIVLAASLASLALIAAPSGAQGLGTRAVFGAATGTPSTFIVNSPGAPVLCSVSYGNDVTIDRGFLTVTWAVACRWTDDGQLSTEADAIYMQVGIRKGTSFIPTPIQCPIILGAAGTCNHRVPFDGTSAHYDSVMAATVTWNDGYPPISGTFLSPGFIYT